MARIFISYRREDGSGSAGRLHDRLREHFGRDNVFMDVDTIEPGLDFIEVIERMVASCDVLIALIGRQWLAVIDAEGQRRLDDPDDFVRHEIATALKRNIRVIPALIQDTSMPRVTQLPPDLQPLTRRNALELSDAHFHRDVDGLIETLDRVLGMTPPSSRQAGVRSAAATPSSPTRTATSGPSPATKVRSFLLRPLGMLGIACIGLAIIFVIISADSSGSEQEVFLGAFAISLTVGIVLLIMSAVIGRRRRS